MPFQKQKPLRLNATVLSYREDSLTKNCFLDRALTHKDGVWYPYSGKELPGCPAPDGEVAHVTDRCALRQVDGEDCVVVAHIPGEPAIRTKQRWW